MKKIENRNSKLPGFGERKMGGLCRFAPLEGSVSAMVERFFHRASKSESGFGFRASNFEFFP
jgi:hypothetical protein